MDDIIRQREIPRSKKAAPTSDLKTKKTEGGVEFKDSRPLIRWEALEYEYVPKSNNWFWTVGIIFVGLSIASVLLGNFLFAILVLIAGFAVILMGIRRPKKISFSFTVRGLQIEKRLFPYENLKSFWIHFEPPHKKLLTIEPKKFFMPIISVPLGDINPNVVREHLLKFLKEERHEESFIQTIIRLAGL
jgi:hypothetical protein